MQGGIVDLDPPAGAVGNRQDAAGRAVRRGGDPRLVLLRVHEVGGSAGLGCRARQVQGCGIGDCEFDHSSDKDIQPGCAGHPGRDDRAAEVTQLEEPDL